MNALTLSSFEPGYLTAIVLVLIFLAERIVNYYFNKSIARKNWYIEVIVKSNLKHIDNFYQEVEVLYNEFYRTKKPQEL